MWLEHEAMGFPIMRWQLILLAGSTLTQYQDWQHSEMITTTTTDRRDYDLKGLCRFVELLTDDIFCFDFITVEVSYQYVMQSMPIYRKLTSAAAAASGREQRVETLRSVNDQIMIIIKLPHCVCLQLLCCTGTKKLHRDLHGLDSIC